MTNETNTTSIAPLPCPFCGSTSVSVKEGSTFRWRIAYCNECDAQAGEVRAQTSGDGRPNEWEAAAIDRAIAEWNKRDYADEIDRLREDRDAFRASSDIRGAEVERLTARVAEWEQKAANWMASPEAGAQLDGYRELAQRLNAAEMRVAELERALLLIEPSGDFSGWEDRDGNDIGAVINAALSKDGA